MDFEPVRAMLERVIVESDVDNGTKGLEFTAHFWEEDLVQNKDLNKHLGKLGSAWLDGKIELFEQLSKEQESIKPTQRMMTWAINPSLGIVHGTKRFKDAGKIWKLSMNAVSKLYISENVVKLGLIEYEETSETANDAQGRPTPIVKMRLKKGIIDIAPPIMSWKGEEIVPKRAFVTPISFHALQIAGELIAGEDRKSRRRYGFDAETI